MTPIVTPFFDEPTNTATYIVRDPASDAALSARIDTCRANIRDWRQSHAYSALAPRLWRVICSL